jgi:hypothetical protein
MRVGLNATIETTGLRYANRLGLGASILVTPTSTEYERSELHLLLTICMKEFTLI